MTDTPLADLLTALDVVVMQRVAPGSFYLHGTPTAWMRRVNARWKGERQLLASRTFPFLDHFLIDAEAFWATGEPGRTSSGLSSEPGPDGVDVHFEAWAVTVEPDAQYLVLELKRDGAEFQAMLQRAREGLLEHERLQRTLDALERSQSELRRAKTEAEHTAASHSAMLRTITQEVRTPVHAMIGLAGLLLDSAPPAQARFLSLIRSSSETLLTVLNDMLDVSRLEIGAVTLEARPFEVRDTIEEALGVVSVRAAERGIDLACQVELAVPETVVGDRSRWRRVLVNLLDNAVTYAVPGEVLVYAEATDQGDGQTELHVAVNDGRPGLPTADIERLIAAPAEGAAAAPRQGMGLAACRAIVERMNGRLWADGTERGTTFHFTTRVAVAPGPSSPSLCAHQPALDRRRAWIVGVSRATEQLLVRELRFWGMVPRTTRDVRETTRWLSEEGAPDIVIVDRTALLAETDSVVWPAPVIELVSIDRAHEAASRPVAALLTKPLRTSRLHAHLVSLLARSGARC